MFFRKLFGGGLDQIIWNGLPTTCLPSHEVTVTTAANASNIVQRDIVVTLRNNQNIDDIIYILDRGWIIILEIWHPLFRNEWVVLKLRSYPATYSVDSHWIYSPKPLTLELAERLS